MKLYDDHQRRIVTAEQLKSGYVVRWPDNTVIDVNEFIVEKDHGDGTYTVIEPRMSGCLLMPCRRHVRYYTHEDFYNHRNGQLIDHDVPSDHEWGT